MRKVFISGCGIGKKMGLCDACNLDFSWLFSNASTILWADKICLPKDLYTMTVSNLCDKQNIAISIMLLSLQNNGLIELLDDEYFETTPIALKRITTKMASDIIDMEKAFPENIKVNVNDSNNREHLDITIDGYEYCIPYIGSIYASLFYADEIGAHCLFNSHTYTFLKYKMGLDNKHIAHKGLIDTYNDIFTFVLPDEKPPIYAIEDVTKCSSCKRIEICSSNLEKDTKQYIDKIVEIRNYDELFMLREEIDKIVLQLTNSMEDITTERVKQELIERRNRINKLINRRFEQVKRWTKIATICSIPVAITLAAESNIPAAVASASISGVAQMAEKAMEIYESRKKWVGFLHIN